MLTGSLPFYEAGATEFRLADLIREGHAKPPKELNPAIPAYVEEPILKAISSDQNDRFQNMREFIAALKPPPELKMADHHFQAGAIRRAEHVLRSLIGRRPNDARGCVSLASLLNRCHRPAEAKEALVRAINLEPKDAGLHMQMSLTLDQLGEKEEAKQLLARAERLCTDRRMLRHIQRLRDKMENL
jgi:predicted Zn-dependent protease